MSLRLKLLATSLVLIVLAGGLGLTMLYEEDQVQTVVADEQLNINKIVSGFLDLDVMTDELETTYTVSGATQWQNSTQQIKDEMAAGQFDEPNETLAITAAKQNLDTIQTAMTQLAQSELSSSAQNLKTRDESFTTIKTQIQAGLANSLRLQQVVGGNLVDQQASTKNIIVGLCVTLVAIVIASFAYLFYSISMPIRALTAVIEDISRGKLDASINNRVLNKKDEIGQLARAFDRTIVSLKLAMREETKPGDTATADEHSDS